MTGFKKINPIPAALIPYHIDHLKAKSLNFGGETLAQHTWDVLSRLADQTRLRSRLAETINAERLWSQLFWSCFLHDFGKAATGFQERLQENAPANTWSDGKHRH